MGKIVKVVAVTCSFKLSNKHMISLKNLGLNSIKKFHYGYVGPEWYCRWMLDFVFQLKTLFEKWVFANFPKNLNLGAMMPCNKSMVIVADCLLLPRFQGEAQLPLESPQQRINLRWMEESHCLRYNRVSATRCCRRRPASSHPIGFLRLTIR